jgi:ribosomal protein S18 acetylase RimI-like enzyme
MERALRAHLARRPDREAVLAHLLKDPLANLLLIDMAARLGSRPAAGDLRAEVAVARRAGKIVAAVGLRPSVVFDAGVDSEEIEAFLPFLDKLGVGLVKSAVPLVDEFWTQLLGRGPRRAIIDRHEIAYVLRSSDARLAEPGGRGVRQAAADDHEPLVLAARESLREEGRPDPFVGDVRGFRRWVLGRAPRARVVECKGRIVFVGYADVQRPEGWLLQGIYTWPEARVRGFATVGVSDLCREAFAAGADHVQLAVVEGNAPGIRLYESLGFKPFGRLRTILFTDA